MENLEKKMQVRKHNQMQNAQLKKGCNPYETQRDWAKKVGFLGFLLSFRKMYSSFTQLFNLWSSENSANSLNH